MKPRTAGLASAIYVTELSRRSNFRGDPAALDGSDAISTLGLCPTQLIRLIDLGSKNRDLSRSFYADFDGIAVDSGDFDVNKITDDDAFVDLS